MKSVLIILLCSVVVCIGSCVSELEPVVPPEIDYTTILSETVELDTLQSRILNGVYVVEELNNRFGDTVAVRSFGSVVTIYTVKGVSFFALKGGTQSDSVKYLGYWRGVQGPETGKAELFVSAQNGGKEIVQAKGNGIGVVLEGTLDVGSTKGVKIKLRKVRAALGRLRGFQIIAHRGGGRNSERLGYSENSIPMILASPFLGATGIEIDVMSTKDRVPILFHDPTFTARTVPSPYVIGSTTDFTLRELLSIARLRNGERIPTLKEALRAVIDNTNLQFVWLDVKDAGNIDSIIIIQKQMMEYAALKRRGVEIVLGIPTDEVKNAYLKSVYKGTVPVLCELDLNATRETEAVIWAPRFTAGVQVADVKTMQDEGRRCFVWTLDDPAFMQQFIEDGEFDGILTNYPTLLAGIFYTKRR